MLEPPIIKEWVARLRKKGNGLHIRTENKLIRPGAVEQEQKSGLRVFLGDSLKCMVGKPSDAIQFAGYQQAGIDRDRFAFHTYGHVTGQSNRVLPIFEVPRAAILCI